MTHLKTKLMQLLSGAVALLLLTAAPAVSRAAGIAFTNQLDGPILIQGTSIVNGMLLRGQPILIYPGKTGYDPNVLPGPRAYVVYDANRPNIKVLTKTVMFPGGLDVHYLVAPALNPGSPYNVDFVVAPKKN